MNNHIIICGLPPQGLFLLREFAKNGYLVHVITTQKTPAYYSKYGKKYLLGSYADIKNTLADIYKTVPKNTRCIVASGIILTYFLKECPEIYSMYNIESNPIEAIECFENKYKTYELANKINLKYPKTYTISSILKEDFPVFVKKSNETEFKYKSFKTAIVHNQQELENLLQNFTEYEHKFLVFQEYIAYGKNISFLGYFRNGKCIGHLVVKQVRQYPEGITSCVEEYYGELKEEIITKATSLISSYIYNGFVEVEFKVSQYNEISLIEVNPRVCGWGKAFKYKFLNFNEFVENFYGHNVLLENHTKKVIWVNLLRDILAMAKNREWKSVFTLFKAHYDMFEINDVKPFFMQIVNRIKG
jgi:predicted ATP-grasp superfamily ATP-dependent carboligase